MTNAKDGQAANIAAADRVYALVQGHIVLQAPTDEPNLPQRIERAYFGHHVDVLGIGETPAH